MPLVLLGVFALFILAFVVGVLVWIKVITTK